MTDLPDDQPLTPDQPEIVPQPSFTCPWCGGISYNPNDVRERYCGHCHSFEGDREEHPPDRPICSICGSYYEGHGHNAKPINAGRCCDRCDALVVYRRMNDACGHDVSPDYLDALQRVLGRGSEPFWMQDIRLAQRQIQTRRLAARSKNQAASSSEEATTD